MAGKIMELAIAIKGKLDGSLPASLQKTNSEISQLSAKIRAMKSEQASYDAALRKGTMSQATYNSVTTRMAGNVNSAIAMQNKLKNSVVATNNTARSMGSIGGMFTAPFSAASGAVSGLTGKLAMCQEKIMGFTALAAGGFGLASLVGSAVNSGESLYQLSTKLHMTAGEASQMNKILSMTGGSTDAAAKALMRMDKTATASSKAGDEMRATLERYGVTLTDSDGKLLPMNEQLKAMADGYKKATENGEEQEFVMNTLGVKGMELTKTLQNYDEAAAAAGKIKGVGMDPQKMHELYLQMQQLKMQAGQFGLVFASALAPIAAELLPPIMQAMTQIAAVISKNKDVISQYAIEILKLGAAYIGIKTAIGTVTGVMGGVGGAINLVKTAFNDEAVLLRARPGMWLAQKAVMMASRAATMAMAGAQVALNAVMSANPIAIAVIAFMALAAAIVYLWNTNEEFRNAVISAWESIKSTAMQVWTTIAPIVGAAWNAIKEIAAQGIAVLINIWQQISPALGAAFAMIVPIASVAINILKTLFVAWVTVVAAVIRVLIAVVGAIFAVIVAVVSTAWSVITTVISAAITVISAIISILAPIFSAVWSIISAVAKVAFIVISVVAFAVIGAIVAAIQMAAVVISAVWSVISAAGAAVWSVIGPIAMACIDAIVAGIGVLASVGSAAWDMICAAASVAWSIISAVASAAWSIIMAIADAGGSAISAVWDTISSAASACWDAIVSAVQSAWDYVMSIIDNGVASVTEKWENLKSVFSSPIQAVVNFVKGGDSEAQSGAADAGYSARGGIFSSPYLTWVAEAGSPEAIVPLDGSSRAMGLWQQAGRMLGALPAGSPAMSMVAGATPLAATMAAPAPMANISNDESTQSINMTFNPTINVSGSVEEDVIGQIRAALAELVRQLQEKLPRMMEDIHAEQRRLSYE